MLPGSLERTAAKSKSRFRSSESLSISPSARRRALRTRARDAVAPRDEQEPERDREGLRLLLGHLSNEGVGGLGTPSEREDERLVGGPLERIPRSLGCPRQQRHRDGEPLQPRLEDGKRLGEGRSVRRRRQDVEVDAGDLSPPLRFGHELGGTVGPGLAKHLGLGCLAGPPRRPAPPSGRGRPAAGSSSAEAGKDGPAPLPSATPP